MIVRGALVDKIGECGALVTTIGILDALAIKVGICGALAKAVVGGDTLANGCDNDGWVGECDASSVTEEGYLSVARRLEVEVLVTGADLTDLGDGFG